MSSTAEGCKQLMWITDGWIQLTELSKMFGLSEESIKRLVKIMVFRFAE